MAKQELRMPDEYKENIVKFSKAKGWSQNAYIVHAIEQQIERDVVREQMKKQK